MLRKLFSRWRAGALIKRASAFRRQPFSKTETEILIGFFRDKRFSLFLEFLELTVSENIFIYSNIDVANESGRMDAIKQQNYTRGILDVRNLVESLIRQETDEHDDDTVPGIDEDR
jgi:hypothetical protein